MTNPNDDFSVATAATPHPTPDNVSKRVGWPELITGLLAYAALVAIGAVFLRQIPDDQPIASGFAGYGLSAVAALGACAAAVAIRIRGHAAFGIRKTHAKWLALGAVIGAVAWPVDVALGLGFTAVTGIGSPQGDYQAAGNGGLLAMVITLLLGAVATPIGEEFLFRGVVANALNKYGPWAGVLGSAAIFALVHGINPVIMSAFVVGIITALLFRKTGSVWPGVFVHAFHNGASVIVPLIIASLS